MRMLTNLAKAATALALAPVATIADLCTLPASAHRGEPHPFGRTAHMLRRAAECVDAATTPQRDSNEGQNHG